MLEKKNLRKLVTPGLKRAFLKFIVIISIPLLVLFIINQLSPDEQDFPGISQEMDKLVERGYFHAIFLSGSPLNKVNIEGFAPAHTSIQALQLLQCTELHNMANLFISDKYEVEIKASSSGEDGRRTIVCK
jgi:hypothetical protein